MAASRPASKKIDEFKKWMNLQVVMTTADVVKWGADNGLTSAARRMREIADGRSSWMRVEARYAWDHGANYAGPCDLYVDTDHKPGVVQKLLIKRFGKRKQP